jgi:prepilin-type N-terminal cleavage/methylation domain-containing protein/prepilin-type processing-associated H-X9-DG protein
MSKHSKLGFTLVELLVVIAIIALLMGMLMPALSRAREYGKRAVCLSYQKQMATAWIMYADDSSDRIVNGDAEEYGWWNEPPCTNFAGECLPNKVHAKEKPWVLMDWAAPPCWPPSTVLTVAQKKDQVKKGSFFRYTKDIRVYKCPRANADEVRTYSVVDGMNVIVLSGVGSGATLIKNRQQIRKPYERFVFIENGGLLGGTMGGWTVFVSQSMWWDLPSARHGDGTTFSFADGHSEYHKWLNATTLDDIKKDITSQPRPGNQDIRWASIGAWGSDVAGKGN